MPTTQVNSNRAFINSTNATASTSNSALVDAGAGVFADTLTLPAATVANGLFYFSVNDTTGLELHFAMTSALSVAATARIMRVIPLQVADNNTSRQWTFRHLCDIDLTASSQTGVASGDVVVAQRWASAAITSGKDAGLTPLGTRTMNGLTTTAAGSVVIDPLCAPQVVVQIKRGSATDVVVFPSNWTRN